MVWVHAAVCTARVEEEEEEGRGGEALYRHDATSKMAVALELELKPTSENGQ